MKNLALKTQQKIGIMLMCMFMAFGFMQTSYVTADSNTDVFDTAHDKAVTAFTQVKKIILVLGAFGVLVLAVMAFFGKFNMMWFVSLIGGLVLILLVGSLISFLTDEDITETLNGKK